MPWRNVYVEEPLLKLDMALGEGCVWDERTQRLYFVDIDRKRVFTYEPRSGIHGYQSFDKKVTALALREDEPGLMATDEDGFILLPAASLPWPPTNAPAPQNPVRLSTVAQLDLPLGTNRFNEAAVDPSGRFLAGTMGFKIGDFAGKLWSCESRAKVERQDYSVKELAQGITCTNGMAWSEDRHTMYFTDSWEAEIVTYAYDDSNGSISDRTPFSKLDPAEHGWPDGLCMDAEGMLWSSRWQGGQIIRLDPKNGKIDTIVHFPKAWNITCSTFGGPDLTDLYVTTASSATSGDDDRPPGGDLFVVKGLGVKGRPSHRFRG